LRAPEPADGPCAQPYTYPIVEDVVEEAPEVFAEF